MGRGGAGKFDHGLARGAGEAARAVAGAWYTSVARSASSCLAPREWGAAYLLVSAGTTQTHTARAVIGVWRYLSWILKRMETEVERGVEVP